MTRFDQQEFDNLNSYFATGGQNEAPVPDCVNIGDERLKVLDELQEFAEMASGFDPSFVISVQDYLDDKGYITFHQYEALCRVHACWRVEQKLLQ